LRYRLTPRGNSVFGPKGLEEVDTAGGRALVYTVPKKGRLRLLLGSERDPELNCSIVIDPHLTEPVLSDYLTDELGIVVVSFRKGVWRHKSDPEGFTRT